jgi:integrase
MAKVHLSKSFIESIEPQQKRLTFTDDKSRGLTLLVTPNGVKTFYLTRKFRGRVERPMLGRFPDLTLVKARLMAAQIQTQFDAGINPHEAKRQARLEPSLDEFFKTYYKDHSLVKNKRPERVKDNYDRYLKPKLGVRRISDIHRADIKYVMHQLAEKGHKRTANIVHSLIRAMLNKAIAWEYLTGTNQAEHIERYPEKSRDRFLLSSELHRFQQALAMEPNETIKDAILLLMYTGARRGNVFAMRWNEVNFDEAYWRIPDSKNGEPQFVVLTTDALKVLRRRRQSTSSVFVLAGTSATGHIVDIKHAWKRLLDHAGIEDLRVHDLRRTMGSWLLADGHSLPLIGKVLGHKDMQSTQIYARMSMDQTREAVSLVTGRLATLKQQ